MIFNRKSRCRYVCVEKFETVLSPSKRLSMEFELIVHSYNPSGDRKEKKTRGKKNFVATNK